MPVADAIEELERTFPHRLAVRVAAWRASLILRVALADWGHDFGFGNDVRVHITEGSA